MKNAFLLLALIFIATASFAQNCAPDDTLPADFIGISPVADSGECDTLVPSEIAYIETGYSTTLTVFVPAQVAIIMIDSISVKPADDENPGIIGLPAGLTYSCEPASCVFPAGIPGCVRIHGIVEGTVAPDLYDLQITATLNSAFVNGDIRFPLPADPADYNNLETLLAGQVALPECPYQIMVGGGVSTQDLFETEFSMGQNSPNPFTGITSIPVNAKDGDYTFSIYNTVGELVQIQELRLQGRSNVSVDASSFETGVYFYTFSNENGSTTNRMIVR